MSNLTDSRGCKVLVFSGVELEGCVRYKSKLSDDRGFRTASLQNFDRGNFDVFGAFQLDCQNLIRQIV